MKYNLYKTCIEDQKISFNKCDDNPHILNEYLGKIQIEIIRLYEEKQEKEAGIKKLGNEIRYSEVLDLYFENLNMDFYVVKFTENNRYFLSKFIDVVLNTNQKEIYFLILEREFGKESKLVDGSFIRFDQVKHQLVDFFEVFKPRIKIPTFFFIEVKGFTNYFFEDRLGYNFIHKIR